MDNEVPFFSIVLPVYNREKKISKAIQSVLNQTFCDWELIVVDDCSNDGTANSILEFNDIRIHYLRNDKNLGPAFSRNIAINRAKGKVISFLDSDDRYCPTFLSKTFDKFSNVNLNVGFIWTGLEVKYLSGVKNETWEPKIKISPYYTFLKELRIGTNSGLSIRKIVFEKCGYFNDNLTAAEDTEFLLRIVQKFEFDYVKEHLISIDKSQKDRLSRDYKKNALAYNEFIDQHWDTIVLYPELKKKYYYKLMWLNFHLGNKALAKKYFQLYQDEFGFTKKVFFVRYIFKIFGRELGSKIHILLSS